MSNEKDLVTPKLDSFKKEEPETATKPEPAERPNSSDATKKKEKHVRIDIEESHRKRTKSQRSSHKPVDIREPAHERAYVPTHISQRLLTQQYRQASCRKYGNASRCKTRIERLRHQVVNDSLRKLEKKHQRDRCKIRQAHMEELAQLDQFYESVVQMHKERSNDLFNQWEKKQQKDIRKLERSLSKSHRAVNSEILVLNEMEQMLMEKELYPEAAKIRREAKQVQRRFRLSTSESVKSRQKQLKINLWQQHKKEYQVLLDRIDHSCEERELRYKKQREKLEQHYQNVMTQLMRHHLLEVQKLNRSASMLEKFMNNSRNNVRWIIESQQL